MKRSTGKPVILLLAIVTLSARAVMADDSPWLHYGGDLGGTRYANSEIVTPANIDHLVHAWTIRTGDASGGKNNDGVASNFKATPILVDGKLIFSSGFNRVIALDAKTGEQLWQYDPKVSFETKYSEMFTSRGVSAWVDPTADPMVACAQRIYLGTLDARLIALDANSGQPCSGFGDGGEVDLSKGIANFRRGEYSVTSPPTVVNDLVITGSSIGDNGAAKLESGVVRAYDARSGERRWQWDPIPRAPNRAGWETWEAASAKYTGATNVWSVMAADEKNDLVFLPTTSPSPDFYGGQRLGDNQFANSIVALRASSGELVWAYQIVRHDLWDYDLASQPMLIELDIAGDARQVLVLATKMGFVFVLDRLTGEPVFPVVEKAMPKTDVPGERTAATQRFPSIVLHAVSADLPGLYDRSETHTASCRTMLSGVRFEGIFTPPSLEGTVVYPGNPGGVNWGSMAGDSKRQLAFVAVNRLPTVVKLIPRKDYKHAARQGRVNGVEAQFTAQAGTPYGMARYELFNADSGYHCLEGPWATLVAIDLSDGSVAWEVPAGQAPGIDPGSAAAEWGHYVAGGPVATAGGIVFLATPGDRHLTGYDANTGNVVWHFELPASPHATPMSYEIDGTQYVVIAAGGATTDGDGRGDFLIALMLPAHR